jgi:two-component system phosphate regulon response regulator PhoB
MSDEGTLLALVIEDEEEVASILATALQSAGYETITLADGQAAMAKLKMVVPTLVVLDLALPLVSGTDVLREIRADARLKDCLVIVVTGVPILIDGIRDLADLVLVKPFSITQVREFALRLAASKGGYR